MLSKLSASDAFTVYGSIALLALFIVVGVAAAEYQLNHLTQRQEYVQAFNIRRDGAGFYSAHLLGQGIKVRGSYPVAAISSTDRALTLARGDARVTVPTAVDIRLEVAGYWLDEWRRQFMTAARKTKADLLGYLGQIRLLVFRLAARGWE
ncbi:MAG TPA: hypothetical protein PKA10_05530 [Selenomonadales bacterium]|nr:hypothetical protein [Selenomonadales bacterium]